MFLLSLFLFKTSQEANKSRVMWVEKCEISEYVSEKQSFVALRWENLLIQSIPTSFFFSFFLNHHVKVKLNINVIIQNDAVNNFVVFGVTDSL